MDNSHSWLKDELLHVFYTLVDNLKTGAVDEEAFKEKILRLAERYERNFIEKELSLNQKDLF